MDNSNFTRDLEDGTTTTTDAPRTAHNRKRTLWLGCLLGLAVVSAVALGLGFGLNNNNNKSEKNVSTSSNSQEVASGDVQNASSTTTVSNTTTTTFPPPSTFSTTLRLAAVSPESISQTYPSCDALAVDLQLVARGVGERYIADTAMWYFMPPFVSEDEGIPTTGGDGETDSGDQTDTMNDAPMATEEVSKGTSSTSVSTTESSFGTNNQEEGVEEPDIVQSDGFRVYAVYGSDILVLNATSSTLLNRITVPVETTTTTSSSSSARTDSSPQCSETINAMLLVDDRLLVVTNSYCYFPMMYETTMPEVVPEEADASSSSNSTDSNSGGNSTNSDTTTTIASKSMPIVSGSEQTRVLIYDTATMSLLSTESLRGTYVSSRAIDSNVHIITSTYFDFYRLNQFLDPYYLESTTGLKLNETTYKVAATTELNNRIDAFVSLLVGELDCTSMQTIGLWQNDDESNLGFSSIMMDSMVTITSLDIASSPDTWSTKTILIPSGSLTVYSSAQRLVLAVQGWWIGSGGSGASPETFLISYKYNNATASAVALGTVPGYLLNQFSMDHVLQNNTDYLRVATSTMDIWFEKSPGVWESSRNATSQVTILEFNDGAEGQMPVVGQVKGLGKPGEQIYSVRFMGDKAYVVTYLQTDPFYTLDLSDPTKPIQVGELLIPGFSSYLHPVGSNQLIGVGQAADVNGTVIGLQVSLFDVSDPSNPVRLQNYIEESKTSTSSVSSSYSEVMYSHAAFRYLEESKLLILPVSYYEYSVVPCPTMDGGFVVEPDVPVETKQIAETSNTSDVMIIDPMPIYECYNTTGGFDGFRVYNIDPAEGISVYFSIAHETGNDFLYGCFGSAYLQPRAMVFNGDMMTMKFHSILSHNLTTREQAAAPIVLENEAEECSLIPMW